MNNWYDLCHEAVNQLINDHNILYELNNKRWSWIADIIVDYNRLGFYTFVSQPGKSYCDDMYKSAYHRLKAPTPDNILQACVRKQRAYIRGYMDHDMAEFVYRQLQHDPFIFVRTSYHNRPFDDHVKFGSVNFYNDQPVLMEEIDWDCIEETKNHPDADWSFNLRLLLRRPFTMMLGEQYPHIDATQIVEIEFIDRRWNDNDYFWSKVLDVIKQFKKT